VSAKKWRVRRMLTVAVTAVAIVGPMGALAPAGAVTKAATAASSSDRTSWIEARRVDRVPTPRLGWYACYDGAQCATVRLPLDYDQPNGAKTEVALLRRPAVDQAHRIGSLFLNPGGPGGSGVQIALAAPSFLSPAVSDRFDIVGFDPRGTNFSDQVRCFTGNAQQSRALKGFNNAFPVTRAEEQAAIVSARNLGAACSLTGRPLSASMSTAEVARDMDVLRRAVGDRKLTFLGFSYGTYLGQVYANMFPDRVRAVTIDGVLDPVAWAGTPATASRPQTDRIRSADGAYQALVQMLRLCDRAGGQKCTFSPGDPVANYDLVAKRLKKTPLLLPDPFGGPSFPFTYADLVASTLSGLYAPDGYLFIDAMLSDLIILTEPPAGAGARVTTASRSKVLKAFALRLKAQEAKQAKQAKAGFGFPYDNSMEAFTSVLCTDGLNPPDAASWPRAAAAADIRARYFGRLWAWSSVGCASKTWTARDEDAYAGPFTRRTASPILVVGSKWDPATNYAGAVKAASLLPNSRLLSSDNWGHTAYGTSQCATSAIDAYLLSQALPAPGTYCHGDVQPFEASPVSGLRRVAPSGRPAPVVAPSAPRN
jgi:pimeloyl-ACP methyl ester carboxylesterase